MEEEEDMVVVEGWWWWWCGEGIDPGPGHWLCTSVCASARSTCPFTLFMFTLSGRSVFHKFILEPTSSC